jgi:DNA polymerase epsilon subunit 1
MPGFGDRGGRGGFRGAYRGGGNRGKFGGGRGGRFGQSDGGGASAAAAAAPSGPSIMRSQMARRREEDKAFDTRMGFGPLEETTERIGYLYQMLPAVITSEDRLEHSALDMYFIQQDGEVFKGTLAFDPYFFVAMRFADGDAPAPGQGAEDSGPSGIVKEVLAFLEKKFEGLLASVSLVAKEDLEMPNHLSGRLRTYIKLSFRAVADLMAVRRVLQPMIERNARRAAQADVLDVRRWL